MSDSYGDHYAGSSEPLTPAFLSLLCPCSANNCCSCITAPAVSGRFCRFSRHLVSHFLLIHILTNQGFRSKRSFKGTAVLLMLWKKHLSLVDLPSSTVSGRKRRSSPTASVMYLSSIYNKPQIKTCEVFSVKLN